MACYFTHFYLGIAFFSFLVLRNALYILDTEPLLILDFANISQFTI